MFGIWGSRVLRVGRVWAYQGFRFRVAVELHTRHNLPWVGTFGFFEHISNLAFECKKKCVYKKICTCTCTCICLMHTHVYKWLYTYTYIHMYIYIYIYIYVYLHIHTYIYIYICTFVFLLHKVIHVLMYIVHMRISTMSAR